MTTMFRVLLVLNFATVSIFCLTADEIEAERSGWNVNPNTQYHIQTDEGPERYFRFQTLSGQYRKEKRLEDGTVIGTEGWLDPLGYLRLKDYIADNQGFRILRSKTVYVGKNRPIQEAVSASKKVPAQSGILVTPQRPPNPFRQPELKDVSGNSIETNTAIPLRTTSSIPPTNQYIPQDPYQKTIDPSPYEDGYSQPNTNYLVPGYQFQSPYVSPYQSSYPYRVSPPSVLMQPPVYDETSGQTTQSLPVQHQSSSSYGRFPPRYRPDLNVFGNSNVTGQFQEYNANVPRVPNGVLYTQTAARPQNRESARLQQGSSSVNGAEFPLYDGTHTTANGFQYYLKTHYHEEEEQPQDKKIGSFGYIDPFGIRRVVYYSADPHNGFLHKKNNRYVGFNANPYDPLPRTSR